MRRTAVLLCLCFIFPASAGAAVKPTRAPDELGGALTATASAVASLPQIAPLGNPAAVADSPYSDFPRHGGTFAILSSGDAVRVDPEAVPGDDDNGGIESSEGPRAGVHDLTQLRLDVTVEAPANCLTFAFRFLTEEAPGAEQFNDGFIAELGESNWTSTGGVLEAPNNFAFDGGGNVISVNSPGSASLTPTGAAGTGFANGTSRLTAATPVTPGTRTITFSIFDYGDEVVDSAALLDDLRVEQRAAGECTAGAIDEVAPVVSITEPAAGSTNEFSPVIRGTAGTDSGDLPDVTVDLFAGAEAAGAPDQSLPAVAQDGEWSVSAPSLADGTYTVVARQSDDGGNVGRSDPVTFVVATPPLEPFDDFPSDFDEPFEPAPVLGESVVVGKVSGTVRVRLPNGRFRTLGENEEIPLGSTVDATKGRVRLTSAAGPGDATQTAVFSQGQFLITQTRGSRPITELRLNAKLSCGSGRASSSQRRRKVRRLFGDGKGRFRTRARHGAATVRGTAWLTEDRCNSTKFTVRRGSITVRDFVKRKNRVVKRGKSYVIRKRRR